MRTGRGKWLGRGWLGVLLGLAFVLYWSAIGTKRMGDDFHLVFEQPVKAIYAHYYQNLPHFGWYRPIEATFYGIVQSTLGLATWPNQVAQIALLTVLAILVFKFVRHLGFNQWQAGIGSVFVIISQANVYPVVSNAIFSQNASTLAGFASMFLLYRSLAPFSQGVGGTRPVASMFAYNQMDRCSHAAPPACTEQLKPAIQQHGDSSHMPSGQAAPWLQHLGSLTFFAVALLLKETATSFILIVPIVAVLAWWAGAQVHGNRSRQGCRSYNIPPDSLATIRRISLVSLPYVALFLIYFVVRSQVVSNQPQFVAAHSEDGYGFRFGPNIPRNIAMLFFAGLSPFSTVATFNAVQLGDKPSIALFFGLTVGWTGLVALGCWRTRKPALLGSLVLAAIGSLFPMALMLHVSELYTYNLMPWLAILVGIGAGQFIVKNAGSADEPAVRPYRWTVIALILAAIGATNIWAVRSKIELRQTNGELAESLREQLIPILRQAPPNAYVILRNTPADRPHYSVFQVHGFKLMRWTIRYLKQAANRPDLTISIIDPNAPITPKMGQLPLTLQDSRVVPYSPPAPTRPAGAPTQQETP